MKKIFTLLFVFASFLSYSQSTTLVISQLYGAGGNAGAVYNADYVELHNISGAPISLSGYTIQYGSSAVAGAWSGVSPLPAVSIPAGGYYLIQMSTASAVNGIPLPTVDYVSVPSISMAAASGRVALVNGLTALNACPATGSYTDFVGYGAATCFEGAAACPTLSTILAGFRGNSGCTDTDNNGADFTTAAPLPRNSATPIFACGAISPSLTVTGTIADFGNIFVGSTSTSQTYDLSGSDLTGFPGNINVTAPSTDFQVSNDNSTWGASTTIAYTSATLAATAVWVRFSPQSAGLKTGNVTNSGGGASVTVAVSGTGITPPTPLLTATALTAFGNVCLNATAGPNDFTINGSNLTAADITVGPLAGYTFSTTAGGTYTASLTLTQAGGTFSQQIFVDFIPVAMQSYDGNIDVTGGGAPAITVAASGAGANNPPSLTTGAASAITTSAATLAGTITATGCSAVSAYGIEYSTTNGFPNGTGTQVTSTNLAGGIFSSNLSGLTPATIYYYHAYATNAGGTGYGSQQSFTTATPALTATPLTTFGSICINTTGTANSFTISSPGITAANITVGPLSVYGFSTTATGPFTPTLSLTHPAGPYSQVIFVQFFPTAVQSYNGNIPVGGGGANTINIAVSGSGDNAVPTVVTGTANVLTPNKATLNGTITAFGCTSPYDFGIVYSGIDGFTPGYGTKVRKFDVPGTDYSVDLNSLVEGATYYYRAYAKNDGGIAYGAQETFTMPSIPSGLVVYSSPITRGGNVHYTLDSLKPGHYQVKIFNSVGQQVFQREVIIQVNFIDDNFILPGNIGRGIYTLQVFNHEFKMNKLFFIQ